MDRKTDRQTDRQPKRHKRKDTDRKNRHECGKMDKENDKPSDRNGKLRQTGNQTEGHIEEDHRKRNNDGGSVGLINEREDPLIDIR